MDITIVFSPNNYIKKRDFIMKKITALVLLLTFLFALSSCGGKEPTQLGTSDLSIVLPRGYAATEDDLDKDQVAYFYKDDNSLDFDVYQWAKGGEYALETEAEYFATQYGTVPQAVTYNGIAGWKYVTTEDYEGISYTVLNYMFEDDISIVEICFWTDGSDAENAVVEEILSSLAKK